MNLLQRDFSRYLRFIVGGGLGLAVNLAITYLLNDILGLWFRIAYAIGLCVNLFFNFYFHAIITFKKFDDAKVRLIKFVPLTIGITATNYVLVLIFTELIILNWLVFIPLFQPYYNYFAIIGVTGFVSILNYVANKYWIFR